METLGLVNRYRGLVGLRQLSLQHGELEPETSEPIELIELLQVDINFVLLRKG
jgi:hypothetical protein